MKQLKTKEELIGKTITNVRETDNLTMLQFEDEFVILRAEYYGDLYPQIEIDEEDFSTTPNTNNYYILFELGLLSEKEYEIIHEEEINKHIIAKQESDFQTFLKLKEKFESNE